VPARVRIKAAGTELDAARLELAPLYEGTDWHADVTTGTFGFRYAAAGDTDMSLRTSTIHGRIEGDIPPGDEYVVQWITTGRAVVDVGRDEVQVESGSPQLFPADRPFRFAYEDYDQRIVHLSKSLVESVAAETGRLTSGGLRFDHTQPVTRQAALDFRDAVSKVSAAAGAGPTPPLLWAELKHSVAASFLRLYEPQNGTLPRELLLPGNAVLRDVVEYLHAHAHLPLTATDIAQRTNLSVRGTQLLFQRVLGCSPLTYLRRIRLQRTRDELLASDPDVTSVADVARAWGFAHVGRFAGTYADEFGEYPSATLHRAA